MQVTEREKVLKTWISRTTQPYYNPLSHNQLPFSRIRGAQFLFAVTPYPVLRRITRTGQSLERREFRKQTRSLSCRRKRPGGLRKSSRFRDGPMKGSGVGRRRQEEKIRWAKAPH